MKVCFIYREQRETGFSIEEVFRNVRRHLPNEVEQIEFQIDKKVSWLRNSINIKKLNADVYHITGDCHYIALFLPRLKTVLTIHDIRNVFNYKGVKGFLYKLLWFKLPLLKLKYVTYISKFTKDSIKTKFKISTGEVIYNPKSSSLENSPKHTLNEIPHILQIGSSENKNVEGLIHAVKRLEVKLLLIREFSKDVEDLLLKEEIDFEQHQRVSNEDLQALYEKCDIVFFASTYEGFGLPILEAQLVGRPVVTSNIGSMKEIVGDDRVLVDPYQVSSIKEKIEWLTSNFAAYESVVSAGKENLKRFDANYISNKYFDLYKRVQNNQ